MAAIYRTITHSHWYNTGRSHSSSVFFHFFNTPHTREHSRTPALTTSWSGHEADFIRSSFLQAFRNILTPNLATGLPSA